MPDLSHWDFAEQFSAYDAASLILGIEPRESQDEQCRVSVITERMKQDFENARNRLLQELYSVPWKRSAGGKVQYAKELVSVDMESLHSKYLHQEDEDFPFMQWLGDERRCSFDTQKFTRRAITKWLASIGRQPVYTFSRDRFESAKDVSRRWPWGCHHTEALGHLEAAAQRFWVNYDPTDHTTAVTNVTVSTWLQTERKVSKTMAESIASILRPDGLPTGPRK